MNQDQSQTGQNASLEQPAAPQAPIEQTKPQSRVMAIVAVLFSTIGLILTVTTLKGGLLVIVGFIIGAIVVKKKLGGRQLAYVAIGLAALSLVIALVKITLDLV